MRLQLSAVGRLATTPLLLAVAASLAPSLAAQSPAGPAANYGGANDGAANYGVAGRAFWGIAAAAPMPQPLPTPVVLAPAVGKPVVGKPVVGGPVAGAAFAAHGGAGDSGAVRPWPAESCEFGVVAGGLPVPYAEAVRPAPFPYGYFGASGTRHWQRHFGFRQAYTQWTLK